MRINHETIEIEWDIDALDEKYLKNLKDEDK